MTARKSADFLSYGLSSEASHEQNLVLASLKTVVSLGDLRRPDCWMPLPVVENDFFGPFFRRLALQSFQALFLDLFLLNLTVLIL